MTKLKFWRSGKKSSAKEGGDKENKTGLSLRSKLLLMLLGAGMSSVVAISYLGYQHGEKQLTNAAFKQLTTLRSSKQQQVEWYFNNLRDVVRVLGAMPTVAEALKEFSTAFEKLDPKPVNINAAISADNTGAVATTGTSSIKPVLSAKEAKLLNDYYQKEFFPRLEKLSYGKSNVEIFWPRTRAGRKAQSLYISGNPHKVGQKQSLTNSGNGHEYDRVHEKYHDFLFSKTMMGLHLYDLFLIDGETGSIVYSAKKEVEFGTSLINGPYSHTALGRLFHDLRNNYRHGRVLMKDYTFYPPSYNKPAGFIGTPVFSDEGLFIGVLAMQLSIEKINNFMSNNNKWKEGGLGGSGEVYLVGDDRLMRSDSRFLIENKKGYLKGLSKSHTAGTTIAKISNLNTSVLLQMVDTKAVKDAFQGERATKTITDYRGVKVISSFAPLDIPDLRWVMLAEMDESEARQPQKDFARKVMLTAGALLLGLTMISLLLASKFLQPISVLVDGVHRIRGGEKHVKIPRTSNDEFGELSDTFNSLTNEIDKRDKIISHQSCSYDNLLNHIYPENIVDRLKNGESNIADSLHQVSVAYIVIHGFSKQTEALDIEDAIILLNEIVDSIDDVGRSTGVEKIKTIGEHYLAVCGLTVPRLDHARRTLDFVHAASREIAIFNARYDLSLGLRVGIHSGPLKAGIVGSRDFSFDIWGNSLNIARRIVFEAGINKLRITTHTYHMLNSTEDFGPEEEVISKAAGKITTYEQPLDIRVDEKRVERKKVKKLRKSPAGKAAAEKEQTLADRIHSERLDESEQLQSADNEAGE